MPIKGIIKCIIPTIKERVKDFLFEALNVPIPKDNENVSVSFLEKIGLGVHQPQNIIAEYANDDGENYRKC